MFIPNYFNIKIIFYLKKTYVKHKILKKQKKSKFNLLLLNFISNKNISLINIWHDYLKFLIFKKFIKKKKFLKKNL